jgi:ABC-type Zn uptake system ZnuABC Zn-binding protein ZnuA
MTARSLRVVVVLVLVIAGGMSLLFVLPVDRAPRADDLVVVTTTPVLYSFTENVAGDLATIVNLVPPGASPENYALRPEDAEALARATVLVINGLQFEQFLQGAIEEARQRGVPVLTASAGVETIGEPPNPHTWLDPIRAARMVGTIADGLATADPAHADIYRSRAQRLTTSLYELDAEFRTRLSNVPRRQFVAFHPAWTYFAERYGLEQVAAVEETPGVEPTARELAALAGLVQRTGTRALMTEPQFSSRLAGTLARDYGLQTYEVNPEGGALAADGYERMMRENVATFARALGVD